MKRKVLNYPVIECALEKLDQNTCDIEHFFENTNVLITGATGFLGKLLVEKLLRSFTLINKIFLLLREKRGDNQEVRLKKILSLPIFDKIKAENPDVIKKLNVICGDLEQENLGLSSEDEEILKNDTHIVFHVGATVRFDEPIKKAIILNTRGTRDLLNLAKKMKNLKVFVHVSTAYCNVDKPIIDEVVYPSQADWATMIRMAETMKPEILNCLQPKIMNGLPNTYVFTKSLAENIVYDQRNEIPCVIYRPSIVFNTWEEPLPGWIDNLNGPMGLVVGGGTGIVHTIYGAPDSENEFIPADVTILAMIISAWYQGNRKDKNNCLVVNAGMSALRTQTLDNIIKDALDITYQIPFKRMICYPFVLLSPYKIVHNFRVLIYHIIPGIFLDILLKYKGNKLSLMRIYRKVYFANNALSPFMTNSWKFVTKNFLSLNGVLKSEDRLKYNMDFTRFDYEEMRVRNSYGLIYYFFNDRDYDIDKAKAQLKRFYILYIIGHTLFGLLIAYFLWKVIVYFKWF